MRRPGRRAGDHSPLRLPEQFQILGVLRDPVGRLADPPDRCVVIGQRIIMQPRSNSHGQGCELAVIGIVGVLQRIRAARVENR